MLNHALDKPLIIGPFGYVSRRNLWTTAILLQLMSLREPKRQCREMTSRTLNPPPLIADQDKGEDGVIERKLIKAIPF
jgi:hypothetical protein